MVVFEFACFGPPVLRSAALDWHDRAARAWSALPGLVSHDLYTAVDEGAKDPLVDDGPGPLLIAMLAFADVADLTGAISGARFTRPLAELPAGTHASGEAMERRFYAVAGEEKPAPLRAPFSYVVRYHRPAADEAAFI